MTARTTTLADAVAAAHAIERLSRRLRRALERAHGDEGQLVDEARVAELVELAGDLGPAAGTLHVWVTEFTQFALERIATGAVAVFAERLPDQVFRDPKGHPH